MLNKKEPCAMAHGQKLPFCNNYQRLVLPSASHKHVIMNYIHLRRWAQACDGLSDLDLVFAADEWLAPIVAASSKTSVFANTDEARFWRSVLLAFPAALSWICTEATPEEATMVKVCLKRSSEKWHST